MIYGVSTSHNTITMGIVEEFIEDAYKELLFDHPPWRVFTRIKTDTQALLINSVFLQDPRLPFSNIMSKVIAEEFWNVFSHLGDILLVYDQPSNMEK